ncbi:MAG: PilC/PilY family type IV pilus protein [Acidobacteriota bacterium]
MIRTSLITKLRHLILGLSLFALGAAGLAIRAQQGWDPLRQVSQQMLHPNIMIVLDVSGSMAWDTSGNYVGADSTGQGPSWYTQAEWCGHRSYRYRYYLYGGNKPSRIAIQKNVLGNSVTLTEFDPPSTWPAYSGYTYLGYNGWAYVWEYSKCTNRDPGPPFPADQAPGLKTVPPQDIVGKTSGFVNWGLTVFSGYCSTQRVLVTVNPNDNQQAASVSSIESYMRLVSQGGTNVGGSTPTRAALETAQTSLVNNTYPADTKRDCGRAYGVILVTDGQSNNCNPSNSEWGSCPSNYTAYPAGISEQLWLGVNGNGLKDIRTWTIGVSNEVGRCELNYTAYMGRTDASSPDGDAGFNTSADPYLPTASGDTSHYDTTHGDYAYFATTADAIRDAFTSIVAGAAAGDYSTGSPVGSSAISSGNAIVYITSADYPGWKGHLYSYDITNPLNPYLDWDAGQKLENRDLVNDPRHIYTWDSNGNLVDLTSESLNQVQQKVPQAASLTPQALDYLRGFDGTQTDTKRAWILGPIINSTPAVVSAPELWKGGAGLPSHGAFESDYASRHPLVAVGSSDGMLHFFDVADGYEVFAVMPPDQLSHQVELYDNYSATNGKDVTGESPTLADHVYGVANSPRFGDVYFAKNQVSGMSEGYHTIMLLTEGKGGDTVAALDVTHTYPGRTGVTLPDGSTKDFPADPNYDTSNQTKVVWSNDASSLGALGDAFSVPAMGADSTTDWTCIFGSGENGSSTPYLYKLNLNTGVLQSSKALTPDSTSPLKNEAYTNGVLFNTTSSRYLPNNLQNLGVVGDTNGRLWFITAPGNVSSTGITLPSNQPIYFSPAVGYYSGKDIYAFASGNFYETSPAVTGTNPSVTPTIYVVAKTPDASPATTPFCFQEPIQDFVVDPSTGETLHASAQIMGSPSMLIPDGPNQPVVILFTVYDPNTSDCAGTSYLLEIDLDVSKCQATTSVLNLGGGPSSPPVMAGGYPVVAVSGRGSAKAKPKVITEKRFNVKNYTGINFWMELK